MEVDWSHTGDTFTMTVSGDRDLGEVVDRFAPWERIHRPHGRRDL